MKKSTGNIIKQLGKPLSKWTRFNLRELLATANMEIEEWERVRAEVMRELGDRK